MEDKESVIVLHGITKTSRHMRRLAAYLADQGFQVFNLDYPSTRYPLEQLVSIVRQQILGLLDCSDKVHFVGYSMGGLLVRALLKECRPACLGRVVQLAPPNNGSEVADYCRKLWIYKKLFGPAGQQLITDQSAISELFGPVDYELGVIAGCFALDPIGALIIKGQHDGKVSVASTRLAGMKEHIIVKSSHVWFPNSKTVQRLTATFIKYGSFQSRSL